MRDLERTGATYLRRAVGRRRGGVREGVTGNWRQLLSEQHLRSLTPLLTVNSALGYGED
jgi:hypothetical protein